MFGAMAGHKKVSVLLVGDSSFDSQAVRSTLLCSEYEVLSASTPEQAVAYCVNNRVAAVVLNSRFVTEHGWSAAQTLKLVNNHVPIVYLQGSDIRKVPAGVDEVAATLPAMLEKLNALIKDFSA
jgi:PleD family two-component response regulator